MAFGWIDAEQYSMNVFLLFERWALRYMIAPNPWFDKDGRDYQLTLGTAMIHHPDVCWYIRHRAPECTVYLNTALARVPANVTDAQAREAEIAILNAHDSFVVYAYPEVMQTIDYIRDWSPQTLYDLCDLDGKLVLDVGAGTGRLTFAACKRAKRVYASEPCDTLREYMREKIAREGVNNVRVLDGVAAALPFEDATFDMVLSGHVVGDDYEAEIAEMSRVVKPGGWFVICNGDDAYVRKAPDPELVARGFQAHRHESVSGGVIYNYTKQV